MDRDGAIKLLDAATASRVARYVTISVSGVGNPPSGDEVFEVYLRAKAQAEAAVAASDRQGNGFPAKSNGRSLEPLDEAVVRGAGEDQPIQRCDQWPDRSRALWEPPRVENDDAAVTAVLAPVLAIELQEVVAVAGHERALRGLRILEDVAVGESSELLTLTDRFEVTITGA